ncbi:MAG: M23 family metallopeptidase [Gemmatimonadota bacterium]|nr:MAG: M23 family metallopeptidase [Gemmatimonadota bacterium]
MRVRALGLAVLAIGALVAIWTASSGPSTRPLPVASPIVVSSAFLYRSDTLRRNETLSHLLGRSNIYGAELVHVVDAAQGLNPRRIRDGKVFGFRHTYGDQKPDRITVRLGDARTGDDRILTLARDSAGAWTGSTEPVLWSVDVRMIHGVVESTIYDAINEAVPDSVLPEEQRYYLIYDLADNIYGWVIDFYLDLWQGDRFSVLYERLTSPLGDIRYGRVLAAKIETRGIENDAYVMTDERGGNEYYDDGGLSLRRSFKIRPVDLARLSSRFSSSRFHPILKRRRPHNGTDYAAPPGTPIKATNGGTVTRAGRWGTYGIMVSIRHAQGIETRYGHMSRLAAGIKPGIRVEQNQVIGYVGMSGLASAPHVHYEILRSGRFRDPRDLLDTEPGQPLPAERSDEFHSVMAQYNALLNALGPQLTAVGPDN